MCHSRKDGHKKRQKVESSRRETKIVRLGAERRKIFPSRPEKGRNESSVLLDFFTARNPPLSGKCIFHILLIPQMLSFASDDSSVLDMFLAFEKVKKCYLTDDKTIRYLCDNRFLVWERTSVKTWERPRLRGSVSDLLQGFIFRDVDSTQNLGPTVELNPLTYSERSKRI